MNYNKMSVKTYLGRELNLYPLDEPRDMCYIPWTRFVLKHHDGMAPCCYHLANDEASIKFGRNNIENFETLWQSEKYRQYRREIATKKYEYCNRCPIYEHRSTRFQNRFVLTDMFGWYGRQIGNQYEFGWDFEEEYPHTLELSFDLSCNVKCKTCRNELITNYEIPDGLMPRIIEYAKHCRNIIIGGDGETFFSKYYMEFLSNDFSGTSIKGITIMTNGTLLNKTNWEKINPNTRKLVKLIRISIDASSKDTYEYVREGSKWDILLKNLEFIKELKKEYKFELHSNYTIDKWNYKDVVNFPAFVEEYDFDAILFNYAQQEFRINQPLSHSFVIDETTKTECEEIITMLKETSRLKIY